jgi:SAM-dependent methyltransferase
LEELGYKIEALDYSESMIARAKEKATEKKSGVHFQVADMRFLPVFHGKFDASICLFDSIGYALSNEAILQTFKGIHQNLKENGMLIFEFWHAPAMLKSFDPVRAKRWKLGDREIVRISETSVDIAHSTSTVKYTIYEHLADLSYTQLQETQQNRFFQLQEMLFFINQAGFQCLEYYGGYQNTLSTIDEQTWHVVMVVRK